jgi:hypothetical protein
MDWPNGQQRRAWLDRKSQGIADTLGYYLGPTGIPDKLEGLANLAAFTDAGDYVEAGEASQALWNDPSIQNAARYATAGMALALPFIGSRGVNELSNNAIDWLADEDGAIRLYHGTPKTGLDELVPSPEGTGALGPGVYGSPFRHTAEIYAPEGGAVYEFDAPENIFLGAGNSWDDIPSSVSSYQVWRDQVAKLAEANPEQSDMIRAAGDKMIYDGYPFFRELAYRLGSKEAAQELYKRAGFGGISAMVDGPEVVLFDRVPLAQLPER